VKYGFRLEFGVMLKSKLLILILSIDASPWAEIQTQGQDATFGRIEHPDISTLRYFAKKRALPISLWPAISFKKFQHWAFLKFVYSPFPFVSKISRIAYLRSGDVAIRDFVESQRDSAIEDDMTINSEIQGTVATIQVNTIENSTLIGLKTIEALRFALKNYDFEYVFRTNSSSYVDGPLLLRTITDFPKTGVYAGFPGEVGGEKFASGAGVLLSRDLVSKVVEFSDQWRHGLIDDVALAVLIDQIYGSSLSIIPLLRTQFLSSKEAQTSSTSSIREAYHFRCKTFSPEESIEIMKHIWSVKNNHSG
jgi:hypothetical protein